MVSLLAGQLVHELKERPVDSLFDASAISYILGGRCMWGGPVRSRLKVCHLSCYQKSAGGWWSRRGCSWCGGRGGCCGPAQALDGAQAGEQGPELVGAGHGAGGQPRHGGLYVSAGIQLRHTCDWSARSALASA